MVALKNFINTNNVTIARAIVPWRHAGGKIPGHRPLTTTHAITDHHPPGPPRPGAHRRKRGARRRYRHRPCRRGRTERLDPAPARLLAVRRLPAAGTASAPVRRRLDRRLAHGC